jgi:putative phosphoesterase
MTGGGVIGVVSDTHGQFREELRAALDGVALILHAGDVGGGRVLRQLQEIAPVRAVWGNVDDEVDPNLVQEIRLSHDGVTIHVSHGHELARPAPAALLRLYGEDVVIFGHTHRALVETAGRRLVVNPGAAGPRRFNIRPSVARLSIDNGMASAEIVWL